VLLVALALSLTSPAFVNGGRIPAKFTCNGTDVSPPLRWTAPPSGTRSFRLTVIDTSAHDFVHWDARGIKASARGLPQGARAPREGLNGFGSTGWGGPCPPAGPAHRYVFTLQALDAHGKVLASARLVGRYTAE
jgi:Raf kinase inhibitor-like YbhB/YbcL family protein